MKKLALLIKSHVSAYTKTDGTFVAAHEDKRSAAHKDDSSKIPDHVEVGGVMRPTTNSDGEYIHSSLTGIRNFWQWFGSEGLVDDDGSPIVVYHGGGHDFSGIENKDSGNARFGSAIFVREGQKSGYGKAQHKLYLIGKVLELSDLEDILSDDEGRDVLKQLVGNNVDDDTLDQISESLTDGSHYPEDGPIWEALNIIDEADAQVEIQKLRGKIAKKLGFSAVRTPDEFDGETIMVISASAIKSATGNSGDFDPASTLIAKSDRSNHLPLKARPAATKSILFLRSPKRPPHHGS